MSEQVCGDCGHGEPFVRLHLHLAHRLKHTFTWHWWNGYSRQILINKPTISPTCVAVQIFREKPEFICSYSLQINADTKKQ